MLQFLEIIGMLIVFGLVLGILLLNQKIQEYGLRALLAGVLGGLFVAPVAGLIIMLSTGVHGSKRFAIGMYILTGVVLFYLPITKKISRDYVEEMAAKEESRKVQQKKHEEWIKQERERYAALREKQF